MKVLFLNMLEERHATTRRSRTIVKLLEEIGNSVTYVESNIRGNIRNTISIRQSNNVAGYLIATVKRAILSLKLDYDIMYFQKMLPFHIPCMMIARMRHRKIIIDIDDIDTEYQPNELRRVLHSISDRIVLKLVNIITTHNGYLMDELRKIERNSNIMRLNQCVDLGVFSRKLPKKRAGDKYDLGNKTVFAFLGSFSTGSCKELPLILEAFAKASKCRKDIVLFLIMGQGPRKEKMLEKIGQLNLGSSTRMVGFIPPDEVPAYLSLSHCGLVYMEENRGNLTRFSMKVLEYLAMGIPVVGKLYGATLKDLGEYCNLVSNEDELADALTKFNPGTSKAIHAHQYLVENHDNPVLKNQLKLVVRRVGS